MLTYRRFALACLALAGSPLPARANHSWNGYHWGRTSNPFTLKLGDNLTTNWDTYLNIASADWSVAAALDTQIVPGTTNPKNCRPTAGRVEICNSKYGNTDWLGVASVWVTAEGHIVQGTVKLNDTHFVKPQYNTPAWRTLVVCQEIAHTFGLDHQDEIFNNPNLGTCMDYTDDPDGTIKGQLSNEHPNQHDYEEIALMYEHVDTSTTVSQAVENKAIAPSDLDLSSAAGWGKLIRSSNDGRTELYELNFGHGKRVFTFVIKADKDSK